MGRCKQPRTHLGIGAGCGEADIQYRNDLDEEGEHIRSESVDTPAAARGEHVGLCLHHRYRVRAAAVSDACELGNLGVLLVFLRL